MEGNRIELLDAIQNSAGMAHINRNLHRTFSQNILLLNAQELIEVTSRVNDPDEGLRLMSEGNREAGKQVHREVTRRVHNFVAAALTLVEHTRAFMRDHYPNTELLVRYQRKVDDELRNDPVINFVQGLRNFMLHRGLPDSQMYVNFESDPNGPAGSGTIKTGIRIYSNRLLEWDGWKSPARSFVQSQGEFVDIRIFAEEYTDKIFAFHAWLQLELDHFHANDLKELQVLQAEFRKLIIVDPQVASASKNFSDQKDIDNVSSGRDPLGAASNRLLSKVRKLEFPKAAASDFPGERPIRAMITDLDFIGTPTSWGNDVQGRRVFAFVSKEGGMYGLDESDFAEIEVLVQGILKESWASESLSRSFVEKQAIAWLGERFRETQTASLAEYIEHVSANAVKPLEFWAPIAFFEVQSSFSFGPIEIVPISKSKLDDLETRSLARSNGGERRVSQLFKKLREDMQGLAAVVYRAHAEPDRIREDGEALARIAVGLLRFFSFATPNFPMICANSLLGSETTPLSNTLVLGEDTFNYQQASLSPNPPGWKLSDSMLSQMRPVLDAVGKLVLPKGLSDFSLSIRASITLFGTGATFVNVAERLTYSLSAVEALLLRHSAEQVDFNVGIRMGLLIAKEKTAREEISRNVREAYRLRARREITPLSPRELNSVATFIRNSHRVIIASLQNAEKFRSVVDFVAAIDRIKGAQ